ncbi:GYD domain-containing protein [Halogeometricum borinquense]|uniref:GYD domain n=2 Tax=Halogeometricum borinquense TaxID=60847 RepID=E4NR25_HALBP|nr:GYD domain-containing protein [Halogeometricum borinquense]ADQ66761.1 GYD domain [Halogeometricum borinquense DSM 11551]ELY30269.1 gyd domain protein [Halogeometricum borinquense DSM 11551]QIB74917.1 GYD domain-containing protein [Halogeometricum borinquense]QIQ76083.1 GYD domain-containing protein [Halogeometricum borinquense]RYJ14265.1 GYD domain-containing protein [Halogeometricum borinquense]
MPTYITHVDVDGDEYQNPQELASIWGSIREDVRQLGGEILDTHVVLGPYDFDVRFEVSDDWEAFQVTQVIERHGLDTETMQALPIERLGEVVEDV